MRRDRRRRAGAAWILAGVLAAAACALADDAGPLPKDAVQVYFPQGGCESRWLEAQVWKRTRDGGEWVPHPRHPRIEVETCEQEAASVLLNEFRIRCIDPDGARAPSEWVVGAVLRPQGRPNPCPRY